ncbi:MAG: DinB family protein [Candidatus Heimdallarchaeota archaeon]
MKRAEFLRMIEIFPAELESVVKGLASGELNKKVVQWSLRQVVHHIADSHLNSYIRIKMALTEENPTIKPYNESAWAELPDYKQNIELSLAMIRSVHQRITQVLKELDEKDWTRTLVHPEIGSLTLDQYLEIFATHGGRHLKFIIKSRRQGN